MSAFKKIAGMVTGLSAVGVLGVAIAQGQPPNPHITNPAIGAGQQSPHMTPMGETGVLAWTGEVHNTATLTKEPEVAMAAPAAAEPAPAPQAAPAPEPQVAAVAPEPAAPSTSTMGAGPAPEQPAPVRTRADRG